MKTIRTIQLQVIEKLNAEDITPALKKLKIDFANMKPKNWYFEGLVFESPEFKQNGKPYLINSRIKTELLNSLPAPEEKKTLAQKTKEFLNPALKVLVLKEQMKASNSLFESENLEEKEYQENVNAEEEENDLDVDFLSENKEFMEGF